MKKLELWKIPTRLGDDYCIIDSFDIIVVLVKYESSQQDLLMCSEPLSDRDFERLAHNTVNLEYFDVDADTFDKYSGEDWEIAQEIPQDKWMEILTENCVIDEDDVL